MIKAIILDWAGTTVDFGSITPIVAFKEVLEEYTKQSVPKAVIQKYMGLKKIDHVKKVLADINIPYTETDLVNIMEKIDEKIRQVAVDKTVLIDGTLEFQEYLKSKSIKLGSNTGYTRNMMNVIEAIAEKQGYKPDCTLASDEASAGRPYPWSCFNIAEKLNVFPMSSCVKMGDNIVDIEEGLNANMWSVGIVESSNLIGISEEELNKHPDKEELINSAKDKLLKAGAHLVIRTIKQAPEAVDLIEAYIAKNGSNPQCISTEML